MKGATHWFYAVNPLILFAILSILNYSVGVTMILLVAHLRVLFISQSPQKSNVVGKARKLKFASLLHIANPQQECKEAVVFPKNIVFFFPRNTTFPFYPLDPIQRVPTGPKINHFHSIRMSQLLIQKICNRTNLMHYYSLSKKAQFQEYWINPIIWQKPKPERCPMLSWSVGEKNSHFDHVPYLGILTILSLSVNVQF